MNDASVYYYGVLSHQPEDKDSTLLACVGIIFLPIQKELPSLITPSPQLPSPHRRSQQLSGSFGRITYKQAGIVLCYAVHYAKIHLKKWSKFFLRSDHFDPLVVISSRSR